MTVDIQKDTSKPDGEACRADGTLKDADEMEWPNLPSEDITIPQQKCLLEAGSGSEDQAISKKKARVSIQSNRRYK